MKNFFGACLLFFFTSCSDLTQDTVLNAAVINDLEDTSIIVDYLVISPDLLLESAKELCSYHNNAMSDDVENATVISITTILANYGVDTVSAIKEFLKNETPRWRQPLKYLVILGDVVLQQGVQGIPVLDTSVYRYHDYYYTDFNDDTIADVIVGRIPIRDNYEMDAYLEKILRYNQIKESSILAVADNGKNYSFPELMHLYGYEYDIPSEFSVSQRSRTGDYLFRNNLNKISELFRQGGWLVDTFFLDDYVDSLDFLFADSTLTESERASGEESYLRGMVEARSNFFEMADKPHALHVYYGHASSIQFTSERLYDYRDTNKFMQPTIVMNLGCSSADFTHENSCVRELMFLSKGGPVALIGSPYNNYLRASSEILEKFSQDFLSDPGVSIGTVVGKEFFISPAMFTIIGDPALTIN